jgi:hypothetical protein
VLSALKEEVIFIQNEVKSAFFHMITTYKKRINTKWVVEKLARGMGCVQKYLYVVQWGHLI